LKKAVIAKLKNSVEDYLGWIIDKGFSYKTFIHHKRITHYFTRFVSHKNISWDNLFIVETLDEFLKICTLNRAASSIRGLARFLYRENKITRPLELKTTLADIYCSYLEYKDSVRSCPWHDRILVKRLRKYLETNTIKLEKISIEDMDNFLCVSYEKQSISSQNKARTCLRSFLKYIHRKNIIKRNLSQFIKNRREFAMAKPKKFLRHHEIKLLFDSLQFSTARDLRTNALVYLAYTLGLRPYEISILTFDDIAFQKREVTLYNHKNNQTVVLPLPEKTLKAIIAYIIGARPKSSERRIFLRLIPEYIPLTNGHIAKEITASMRRVGLRSSAGWLRHTYAQNLLEKDISFFEIKEMLRHENIQSTSHYITIHIKLMRKVLFNEDV